MARPKNTDQVILALKAKILEFDRQNGITRGTIPESLPGINVVRFIEDIKAIFSLNTKTVAPFYLDALKQLEDELTYVQPAKFDRLARDASQRQGEDEPESVRLARERATEKRKGIFRCEVCGEVINVEEDPVVWSKEKGGYEHVTDCSGGANAK